MTAGERHGVGMPAWVQCFCCEDYWCNLHSKHVFECDCPPVGSWNEDVDPYLTAVIGIGFDPGIASKGTLERVGPSCYEGDDADVIPWIEEELLRAAS